MTLPKLFLCLLLPATGLASGAVPEPEFKGGIERLDAALDRLLAPDAKIEVLDAGFRWSEGPVWYQGKILFSDVPANTIYSWKEGDKRVSVFLNPAGTQMGEGQGSNGLAVDGDGRLIICQQGDADRRIARLEKDGKFTTLADRCEGKRFTSPNDVIVTRGGELFFTDPAYGPSKDKLAEVDFHGVYRVAKDGRVSVVIKDVKWCNGLALSPDEKTLYVAASAPKNTRIMAYDLSTDGSVKNGRVFFNAQPLQSADRKGACDGMKVDVDGNIWATGPGGVLILNKDGKHLGTILTGQNTGNCAWGDADHQTLYVTANMFLIRVKTKVKGT